MSKNRRYLGIIASFIVVALPSVAASRPESVRTLPVVLHSHLSADWFEVQRSNGHTWRPYAGTVKTIAGTFAGISALASDSDLGGEIISQTVQVYPNPAWTVISTVSKAGRATPLAQLNNGINGLVYNPSTRLIYASETCAIVTISPKSGAIAPFAGGTCGTNDGVGAAAQFHGAAGMTLDAVSGALYVADLDRIRAVSPTAHVTTITAPGSIGPPNGYTFCPNFPGGLYEGLAFDPDNGDVYIADSCPNLIRQIVPSTGAVSVIAGQCVPSQFSSCSINYRDGAGSYALFATPAFIAFDKLDHNLYVTDVNNNLIRRVSLSGGVTVTTLAGSGHQEFKDGVGTSAGLWGPLGIATAFDGSLMVADSGNRYIRKVVAQGPTPPPPSHGVALYDLPIIGDAPLGMAAAPDGSVWYSVQSANKLGHITASGHITEVALPTGVFPQNLAFDNSGSVWFVNGSSVGKFNPSTNATSVYPIPSGNSALDLTLGADGNIWYVTGEGSSIGVVTPTGVIIEYASDPDQSVATGFDGNLWTLGVIRSQYGSGAVDQVSTSGKVLKRYAYPTLVSGPIARGPQTRMWLGQPAAIGEVFPHNVLLYQLPPAPSYNGTWVPMGLVEGPDRALWFSANLPGYVGRMTGTGDFHAYEIPAPRSAPVRIVVAANGTIWFTDPGALKIGRWF